MSLTDGESEPIERRMQQRRTAEDALDDLLRAPPAHLAKWMTRKIKAAGGASPWNPIAAPQAILRAAHDLERTSGAWSLRVGTKPQDGWALLTAGLLHSLGGLTTDATGRHLGCHGATASRRVRRHRAYMIADANYAQRAGHVARIAISNTFPG